MGFDPDRMTFDLQFLPAIDDMAIGNVVHLEIRAELEPDAPHNRAHIFTEQVYIDMKWGPKVVTQVIQQHFNATLVAEMRDWMRNVDLYETLRLKFD
jgi:hypothetical protein